MTNKCLFQSALSLFLFLIVCGCSSESNKTQVLVFSKTAEFRHESIPDGIKMFKKLGAENNFEITSSENADIFNASDLQQFKVVVFLSTTGDILNRSQEIGLQRFIQAGGGFLGIHAAADTEYDWPWYGGLVGAYFNGHPNNPNVRDAVVTKTENAHSCTDHLPKSWPRTDEWYNYKSINPDITAVLNLDETTYEGGTNGQYHPIAWYHEYDGGRAFYSGGGHTSESFTDPDFVLHLLKALEWTIGDGKPVDYTLSTVMPEENRFKKVVLDSYFNEPMELDLLPDGRIVFIERKGDIKLYDKKEGKSKTVAHIDVHTVHEDGLMGIAVDPDYAMNKHVFICYSDPAESQQNVSRFTFDPDATEVLSDEKIILTVPTQRQECCHSAGSVEFGPDGFLWVSFGDNTNPHFSNGFNPIDERVGRSPFDAQKSSANTNDLRGKIIRIDVNDDGTYGIPEGNLFAKDGSQGRPEIYVMGCRNPFRFSIDPHTKTLYWGEVGPDSDKDAADRGPRGHDEINQAKGPGFFGWPYFVGDNKAYFDYNFTTSKSSTTFDPLKPVNDSPNNTGAKELPPAQPAMVYYPYAKSEEFPLLGSGGRNAMAGPVYHYDDYPDNPSKYPKYYDGKLFIYDWMRGWIMSVTFDQEGNYEKMEPFLPSIQWDNLMDVVMSPDGDMYMIEYGRGWFSANKDARLVHLQYTAGNRTPNASLHADITAGSLPLAVNFDAEGSFDSDGDKLSYEWDFDDGNTAEGDKVSHTYQKAGMYNASLTVSDQDGLKSTETIKIIAGNSPPELTVAITGNQMFYWPDQTLAYEVNVTDKEDEVIDQNRLKVSMDYLEQGYDMIEIAQGHQIVSEPPGKLLIEGTDCVSCHKLDEKSIGPSYQDIANKYGSQRKRVALEYLSEKIISGGGGVWGETAMAAHPGLSSLDAQQMAEYVLSLSNVKKGLELAPKGKTPVIIPKGKKEGGTFVLSASYTDAGSNGISPMMGQKAIALRSPTVGATEYTMTENTSNFQVTPDINPMITEAFDIVILNDEALVKYENIDLTGVGSLIVIASAPDMFAAGGTMILYIDDDTKEAVFTSEIKTSKGMGQANTIIIPLAKRSGKHDIILKFQSAKKGATVATLMSLTFNKEQ